MSVQRGIAGPIRRLLCSLTRSCSQRCERPQLNPEAGTAVMRTGESAKEHRLFHHASGPGRLEGSDPGRGGVQQERGMGKGGRGRSLRGGGK